MAKAVQSAGRVIRSETDKGVIVLMDPRFLNKEYASAMPQGWFKESPRELVSNKILADVDTFWKKLETT
ncbi:ATP-dependent DNA helicase DinG [compost metagenome]